mmetsp:Transcript_14318/g.38983  ORF Transcript_14318/g.38983 Transcript_14318/m.38983 type:complete len:250 (+) Transcript_14318:1109-1858(+)
MLVLTEATFSTPSAEPSPAFTESPSFRSPRLKRKRRTVTCCLRSPQRCSTTSNGWPLAMSRLRLATPCPQWRNSCSITVWCCTAQAATLMRPRSSSNLTHSTTECRSSSTEPRWAALTGRIAQPPLTCPQGNPCTFSWRTWGGSISDLALMTTRGSCRSRQSAAIGLRRAFLWCQCRRCRCPTRNRWCRAQPSSVVGSASGRSQLTRSWTVQVSRKGMSGLMGTSSAVTGRQRAPSTRCTSQVPSSTKD